MANKILVVDDDLNICELLKLYLENEGYAVFTANDGQEAVDKFKNKTPDLVLLDIMLPKMDGWQVCREIRKVSSAPIIMLTAFGRIPIRRRTLTAYTIILTKKLRQNY